MAAARREETFPASCPISSGCQSRMVDVAALTRPSPPAARMHCRSWRPCGSGHGWLSPGSPARQPVAARGSRVAPPRRSSGHAHKPPRLGDRHRIRARRLVCCPTPRPPLSSPPPLPAWSHAARWPGRHRLQFRRTCTLSRDGNGRTGQSGRAGYSVRPRTTSGRCAKARGQASSSRG